jgi:dolichol kinase
MTLEIITIILVQIVILGFAEFLRRVNVSGLLIRKIAHMTSAGSAAAFPFFFSRDAVMFTSALGVIVLLIFFLSKKVPFIIFKKHLNLGVVFFPVGIMIATFLFWDDLQFVVYQFAILTLAFSDALAGFIGKKYGKRTYKIPFATQKTFLGSSVFFAVTVIIEFIMFGFMAWLPILVTAFLLTLVEGATGGGIDNVTIPLFAGLLLLSFVPILL